jgi:hypothetical protein
VRSSRLAGVPVPPPTSSLHFSSRVLGSWKWGASERDKLWVEDGDVVELYPVRFCRIRKLRAPGDKGLKIATSILEIAHAYVRIQ